MHAQFRVGNGVTVVGERVQVAKRLSSLSRHGMALVPVESGELLPSVPIKAGKSTAGEATSVVKEGVGEFGCLELGLGPGVARQAKLTGESQPQLVLNKKLLGDCFGFCLIVNSGNCTVTSLTKNERAKRRKI